MAPPIGPFTQLYRDVVPVVGIALRWIDFQVGFVLKMRAVVLKELRNAEVLKYLHFVPLVALVVDIGEAVTADLQASSGMPLAAFLFYLRRFLQIGCRLMTLRLSSLKLILAPT